MAEFKKTQLLTLSFIATLFFLTPLLSSSLRSTYLYFITNLLIIYLGLEAGFLSPSSSSPPSFPPTRDPKFDMKIPSHRSIVPPKEILFTHERVVDDDVFEATKPQEKVKMEEKLVLEDTLKVKKCSSTSTPTPSIFFIESKVEEVEEQEEEERDVEEEEEEELFVKAEVFIGNFYKELRMQREESWNRIHRFYQNGFN